MSKVLSVILVVALFLALRLPGIDLPYHQDEWKNVSAAATVEGAGTFYAHPPLMQMLFVAAHNVLGPDYLRLFTVIFSLAGAALLYFVVRDRAGRPAALWSVILYSVCFYNIFGSIQPDVDGAILPFLFLLAVFAYDRIGKAVSTKRNFLMLLLFLALLSGLLIKLSFVLVIGVIVLDYLWVNRRNDAARKLGTVLGLAVAFGAAYVGLLYLIQAVYPAFSIAFMLGHADQYGSGTGRGWMQILVQGLKAVYYLSPLLLVPLVWLRRDIVRQMSPFAWYLVLGFIFYFLLFDFSQGALDKYLMFAIVPLAAIVGTLLADVFHSKALPVTGAGLSLAGVASAGLAALLIAANFLPQIVVGLHPKTEWFSHVAYGNWNILTPFTGGSGPVGFYVSFLFIAASFVIAAFLAVVGRLRPAWRIPAAIFILVIGLAYNGVFAEELFYGRINGSPAEVLRQTAAFIRANPGIREVITYNDIGARELGQKYAGRFYAAPQFEEGHREKFAKFTGYYMIVDIPHLYENGFYAQFFSSCRSVFGTASGRIAGHVYECPTR